MSEEILKSLFNTGDLGSGPRVNQSISVDDSVRVLFRYMLRFIQRYALAGDADSQDALEDVFMRSYLKNSTGSDVDIDYSGYTFTLENGKSYAMHPGELTFFVEQAAEDGITLTEVDQAEWLISGEPDVFFS